MQRKFRVRNNDDDRLDKFENDKHYQRGFWRGMIFAVGVLVGSVGFILSIVELILALRELFQ